MDTIRVLCFLFLLSLPADLFVLVLLVRSVFGSIKMHWETALVIAIATWSFSFAMAYTMGRIGQSL